MDRELKKSGLKLALAGLIGMLFFWLTDPVHGLGRKNVEGIVDAKIEAWVGTYAGITGSAAILLIGLWVMTRRPT